MSSLVSQGEVEEVVPFAAKLLARGRFTATRPTLPLEPPHGLSREAVTALSDIAERAVLQFLTVTATGWQPRLTIVPGEERPRAARIWDPPVADQLALRFTSASIGLLVALHALAPRAPAPAPVNAGGATPAVPDAAAAERAAIDYLSRLTPEANGDLLLHYLAAVKAPPLRPPRAAPPPSTLANPLCRVAFSELGTEDAYVVPRAIARLVMPDLAPLWPWLGAHLSDRLLAGLVPIDPWDETVPRGVHLRERAVVAGWCQVAQVHARPEVAAPLAAFFSGLARPELIEDQLGRALAWLDGRSLELCSRARPELASLWRSVRLLVARRDDALSTPHVDREPGHHLLLAACRDADLDAAAATLEAAADHIDPAIG